MIGGMAQLHMTEAELVRDIESVLEKVRQGADVVVEQDYRPIAVIRPVKGPGRPIDECIALAKARDSGATLDENFAKDLEETIANRQPLDTSVWE
jgi:antitoxin (DNA-binding transcriptional repressor) of toxin-antitoxin stability system